jgi:hypothetical protein
MDVTTYAVLKTYVSNFFQSEEGQKILEDTLREVLDELMPYTLLQVETN